jgi:CHASE3 domain sensor protein
MKEYFAKIKESLNETMDLLKTKKFDEAIESFSKTIDNVETAENEAITKSEELEKVTKEDEEEKVELVKMKEDMKKWADMYISAENVKALLEDVKS